MEIFNDPIKRRAFIISRYLHPQHKGFLSVKPIIKFSIQCSDQTKLYLIFKNNVLINAKHETIGCSLFIASIDTFFDYIIGKNKTQIHNLVIEYQKMINKESEYNEKDLKNLLVFKNVKIHLNRLICIKIISDLLKNI